jgi:hypothetical protein
MGRGAPLSRAKAPAYRRTMAKCEKNAMLPKWVARGGDESVIPWGRPKKSMSPGACCSFEARRETGGLPFWGGRASPPYPPCREAMGRGSAGLGCPRQSKSSPGDWTTQHSAAGGGGGAEALRFCLSVSGSAAATSPWLRHREDLMVSGSAGRPSTWRSRGPVRACRRRACCLPRRPFSWHRPATACPRRSG